MVDLTPRQDLEKTPERQGATRDDKIDQTKSVSSQDIQFKAGANNELGLTDVKRVGNQ